MGVQSMNGEAVLNTFHGESNDNCRSEFNRYPVLKLSRAVSIQASMLIAGSE